MKSVKNKTSFEEKLKNFSVTKHKLIWLLIPVAIVLVGIILVSTIGFKLGIDFTGGTIVSVVPKDIDISVEQNYNDVKNDIEDVLKELGLKSSQFQLAENDIGKTINVRFQDLKDADEETMNELINDSLIPALYEKFDMDMNDSKYDNFIQASDRIGATSSNELLLKALIAIVVSVVLILIYIAIRFEVASGLSAIVALLSDVLVTCSFVLMFRIQINSSFIAALITIIGYSINNTIIIFDRVRELRKMDEYKDAPNDVVANKAVKNSLVRSINTTTTTLIAIIALAVIGVDAVREFVIPIIIGLVAGTFSSLFVAPNLWALMYRPKKAKKSDNSNTKSSKKKSDKKAVENSEIDQQIEVEENVENAAPEIENA